MDWGSLAKKATDLGGDVMGAVKKFAGDFGLAKNEKERTLVQEAVKQKLIVAKRNKPDFWVITPGDWYKVYPYQFAVRTKQKGKGGGWFTFWYTLPIPPQQLMIKLIPASQVTPTVGGVVEETSDNVFWLIQMSGTTGTAIRRADGDERQRTKMAAAFRERLQTTGEFAGTFANLGKIANKIGGSIDAILKTQQGNPASIINGISGAANNMFLPATPFAGSAVSKDANGFSEIQELHRFLHLYSKLKAAFPNEYQLAFMNNKTGQSWKCVLQDFSIQQSAQNPMLYRYNIQLKCWGLNGINPLDDVKPYDRFGAGGDLQSVNTMGLKKTVNNFKKLGSRVLKAVPGGGMFG